jgi:hypothetical protein
MAHAMLQTHQNGLRGLLTLQWKGPKPQHRQFEISHSSPFDTLKAAEVRSHPVVIGACRNNQA